MQGLDSVASGWRAALPRPHVSEADRTRLYLIGAVALAFLVRFAPVGASSFPLNDGGLFAAMIEDLRANSYVPPAYTSYNGGEIPFAYPPLGFYLAALLSELPGVDAIRTLQVIPLLASTLTVAAAYPLARRLLRTEQAALLAVVTFALLPRAFTWEIMGGGVTRSVGLMFAVTALSPLYDVYARGRHRAAPLAGVLVGLAWLGHLEMGWFAVYSAGVMLAFHRDGLRAKVASTALIGAIAALLTAPWWAGVLARHGLDPFLAALQAGAWSPLTLGRLLFFDFSDAPLLDLFGVLALLGVFVVARERRLLLPVWVLAIFLLDPRKAPTLAMLPTAMLVAETVFTMVLPALRGSAPGAPRALAGWSLPAVFVGVLVGYGALAALAAGTIRPSVVWSPTTPLPEADRAAMAWVATRTEADSSFIVISDALSWGEDRVSEWFPALTGRVSLATPQGTEWASGGEYDRRIEAYDALQACRTRDVSCLAGWGDAHAQSFTHVYLSSRPASELTIPSDRLVLCCEPLRRSLLTSPDYHLVHETAEAQVFECVAAAGAGVEAR